MGNEHEFLDPAQPHMLAEDECALLTFYRFFTKAQRNTLFKLAFEMATKDKRTDPKNRNVPQQGPRNSSNDKTPGPLEFKRMSTQPPPKMKDPDN